MAQLTTCQRTLLRVFVAVGLLAGALRALRGS